MFPSPSSVMPQGLLNSPGPLPAFPYSATNLPSLVNTCRRLFPASAMMTLPFFSHTIPAGILSSPLPLPGLPHFFGKLPLSSTTETVHVHSSVTNTSPPDPTATPNGQVVFPSASP